MDEPSDQELDAALDTASPPEPSSSATPSPAEDAPDLTAAAYAFDPASEGYQHVADRAALQQELSTQRQQLATLKCMYWLGRAGIAGATGDHPNQILDSIRSRRRIIDALCEMWAELGDSGTIPEAPRLETVDASL